MLKNDRIYSAGSMATRVIEANSGELLGVYRENDARSHYKI